MLTNSFIQKIELTLRTSSLPENLAHLLMRKSVCAATSSYRGSLTADSRCSRIPDSVISRICDVKSSHSWFWYRSWSGSPGSTPEKFGKIRLKMNEKLCKTMVSGLSKRRSLWRQNIALCNVMLLCLWKRSWFPVHYVDPLKKCSYVMKFSLSPKFGPISFYIGE